MTPLFESPALPFDLPSFTNHPLNTTSFSSCYAACQRGDLKQVQSHLTLDSSLLSQSDSEGQMDKLLAMNCISNESRIQSIESTLLEQEKMLELYSTENIREQREMLEMYSIWM